MAWNSVKELLGGVPETQGKVVPLRPIDEDELPGGAKTTWRAIKTRMRVLDDLYERKADAERRIAEAVAASERVISMAEREIADERRKLQEDQDRWALMSRDIGIDFDAGQPGQQEKTGIVE